MARAIVAGMALLGACLAAGCAVGPSYEKEDGPRLSQSESRLFEYDNDLEYVCDEAKYSKPARREALQLERLLRSKPDHLFRMKVASSDEPGDLDEDVTVRQFATLNLSVLRKRAGRGGRRSLCFERHTGRLSRAIDQSRGE